MAAAESCERCVTLWREYADATRNHVALIKEQERAAGLNATRFKELDSQVEIAAMRREAARAGIKIHLAAEHTEHKTMTA